jgi:hypothetical protein
MHGLCDSNLPFPSCGTAHSQFASRLHDFPIQSRFLDPEFRHCSNGRRSQSFQDSCQLRLRCVSFGPYLWSLYLLSRRRVVRSMNRSPEVCYGHYSRSATSKTKTTQECQACGRVRASFPDRNHELTRRGRYEKPWLASRPYKFRERWDKVILWGCIFAGFSIGAALCYLAYANVPRHKVSRCFASTA